MQQEVIDIRAKELGIDQTLSKATPVKVDTKKKGVPSSIFSALGEFFSTIGKLLTGTKSEKKALEKELDAFAKEDEMEEKVEVIFPKAGKIAHQLSTAPNGFVVYPIYAI